MSRAVPELSPSVVRLLSRPRPTWRGRLHRSAFIAWLPVGVLTVVAADGVRARVATAVFAVGIAFMFGVSARVHWKAWPAARYHRLIQVDHTAIFACLATTATPVALLALHGAPRAILLLGVWTGAVLGSVVEWLPFHPPRGLTNTLFLLLGWLPVPLLPWIWRGTGAVTFGLLAAGGLVYTVGAVIVGAQRPDPAPLVFGYHEVWHVFVIVAVALHEAMVVCLA
jgi:hemolysin III